MTSDFIALAFASEFTAHHYWLSRNRRPSDEKSGQKKKIESHI